MYDGLWKYELQTEWRAPFVAYLNIIYNFHIFYQYNVLNVTKVEQDISSGPAV